MLQVVILDAAGQPVGAAISVRDERDREHGWMRHSSDRDRAAGQAATTIGPLAPGTYRVTVSNHDGVTATETVTVHGQAELEVRLRLGE